MNLRDTGKYLLDEAIFTAPPHPNWGGAALIGLDGRLQGVGSLLIQDVHQGGAPREGNMFVPIDLLGPILDDLLKFGKVNKPPRPWLGMYTTEAEGNVVVAGLARGAPAHRADCQVGDVVLKVADAPVTEMADMLRRIWALGPVGTVIPLTVSRDGRHDKHPCCLPRRHWPQLQAGGGARSRLPAVITSQSR